jgi:hypothetical protein
MPHFFVDPIQIGARHPVTVPRTREERSIKFLVTASSCIPMAFFCQYEAPMAFRPGDITSQ